MTLPGTKSARWLFLPISMGGRGVARNRVLKMPPPKYISEKIERGREGGREGSVSR